MGNTKGSGRKRNFSGMLRRQGRERRGECVYRGERVQGVRKEVGKSKCVEKHEG